MTDPTKPGDPADRATDAKADGAFQGSHRAGYGDKFARVEEWLRKHPDATLQSGEGAVLLAEIDRLRAELAVAHAAIERVRALHERETRTSRFGSIVWHLCPHCRDDGGDPLEHPCPTLRALDGEDV
jgi:hypothetical protein